jgi:GNAT superfamily N-acetyltransferase
MHRLGSISEAEPVTVRPRTDEDLAGCLHALAAVHAAVRYPAVWPPDPTDWLTPRGFVTGWVDQAPGGRSIAGHVCITQGVDDLCTTALAGHPSWQLASVSRLFVTPPAQGRGRATALLAAACEWSATAGVQLILEVVEEDSSPAIALYDRLGWRWTDRRPATWLTASGQRPWLRIYLAPQQQHTPTT